MKKIYISINNVIHLLLFILILTIGSYFIFSILPVNKNTKLYNVLSGSMSPAIKTGSIIAIKQYDKYSKGDVITFNSGQNSIKDKNSQITTHRISKILINNNEVSYLTKGDANNSEDSLKVGKEQILGKVILTVPYIGYITAFAKTVKGLILFIVIPVTVIIYSELLNIKKNAQELIDRNKKKSEGFRKINPALYCGSIIAVVFGSFLMTSSSSNSFYANSNIISSEIVSDPHPIPPQLQLSKDEKSVSFKVINIEKYASLKYILTYDTDTLPQGAQSEITLTGESIYKKTIELASCSTDGCTYHTGVKNIKLQVLLKSNTDTLTLEAAI